MSSLRKPQVGLSSGSSISYQYPNSIVKKSAMAGKSLKKRTIQKVLISESIRAEQTNCYSIDQREKRIAE